ncbi:hypothetical protein [Chryseobacterium sp.]|uniref:hypothetical protein n=1 Tax=Chryseobacterium sp. TaxID=1871047 RepID=UPI002FC876EB
MTLSKAKSVGLLSKKIIQQIPNQIVQTLKPSNLPTQILAQKKPALFRTDFN